MKKVLFVIPRMRFGGAEKVVSMLANSLIKENIDVTVYSLQNVESFYSLNEKIHYKTGTTVIASNNQIIRTIERLLNFPISFKNLIKIIISEQYDLILPFNYSADILVGICHFIFPKFNYICSERNDPNQIPRIKFIVLKEIYKRALFMVCQSSAVQKYYEKIIHNTIVIPNSIDLKSVPLLIACQENRLVSVGRLDYQKNYELLIEAFSECVKDGIGSTLEIYGDGLQKKRLRKMIIDNEMENFIVLKGVSGNAIHSINGAYCFIMSSRYEGFPNVFLEAMSVGVPIITTDFSPGTAKDIISNNAGIVTAQGDKEELKKNIKLLVRNKILRNKMSKNCLNEVKHYDEENIYPLWKKIIDIGLGQ